MIIRYSLFLIIICFSAQSASYTFLREERPKEFSKPVVSLPPPILRSTYTTESEQRLALLATAEALKLESRGSVAANPAALPKAILKWHYAAQFGEGTACARMYYLYHNSEYGFSPDTENERIYLENKKWWSPPSRFAGAGAVALRADRMDEATGTSSLLEGRTAGDGSGDEPRKGKDAEEIKSEGLRHRFGGGGAGGAGTPAVPEAVAAKLGVLIG